MTSHYWENSIDIVEKQGSNSMRGKTAQIRQINPQILTFLLREEVVDP